MRPLRLLFPTWLALCLLLPARVHAQAGTTLTPDRLSYMVNKDLAGERWTINLNLATAEPPRVLNATGNIYKPDGSPPSFVLCQLRPDSSGSLADPDSVFRFLCQGTDACPTTAQECAREAWSPISRDVQVPASFFLPPGGLGEALGAVASEPLPEEPSQGEVGRGATLTYDGFNFLVNKDLAGERWSISLNLIPVPDDEGVFRKEVQSVTGNVFRPDGSAPSFLYCVPRGDSTGTLDDPGSTFRLRCQGTSACDDTANGCAAGAWQMVADDVQLPASFLLPPAGLPAAPQSDPEIVVIGRTSDPPALISEDFTLAVEAAGTAAAEPVAGACPGDRECLVRVGGCEGVAGRVVETEQGCGCRIEEVPDECVTCGAGATGTCGAACSFPVGSRARTARGFCLPSGADASSCRCYPIGFRRSLELRSCGGTIAAGCPGRRCCVDDPRDGCDRSEGLDCPGVCVFGNVCPAEGDCIDASGSYFGRRRVEGSCETPRGPMSVSANDDVDLAIFQEGCRLAVRSSGETLATGGIRGNEIDLTGSGRDLPIRGCTTTEAMQESTGTLLGDVLELSGDVVASAICESGAVTCAFDTEIRASR